MPPVIPIVETQGRTIEGNGVSRPYKCFGADGNLYFVKTAAMGRDQMIKDWLLSSVAMRMNLPVASAALVFLTPDLCENQNELVPGISYGSREVVHSIPATKQLLAQTDPLIAARILLFDWWCRNEDRKFSLVGGNANLLYLPHEQQLVMIDHDSSMDEDFRADHFWALHGLADRKEMFLPGQRHEAREWLLRGVAEAAKLWDDLPEEWLQSPDADPRTELALEGILEMLNRFQTDENFWNVS